MHIRLLKLDKNNKFVCILLNVPVGTRHYMKINNLKKKHANIRKIELTYFAILCVFIVILGVVAVHKASEYIGHKEIQAFSNGLEFGKRNCPIYLAN